MCEVPKRAEPSTKVVIDSVIFVEAVSPLFFVVIVPAEPSYDTLPANIQEEAEADITMLLAPLAGLAKEYTSAERPFIPFSFLSTLVMATPLYVTPVMMSAAFKTDIPTRRIVALALQV